MKEQQGSQAATTARLQSALTMAATGQRLFADVLFANAGSIGDATGLN
ncbi:MAG TPA: hypothetical protein VGI13_14490 [Candidatus Acidoferrum sp.]|jgi:hypothetical protein